MDDSNGLATALGKLIPLVLPNPTRFTRRPTTLQALPEDVEHAGGSAWPPGRLRRPRLLISAAPAFNVNAGPFPILVAAGAPPGRITDGGVT
jgi:hypothetical protein